MRTAATTARLRRRIGMRIENRVRKDKKTLQARRSAGYHSRSRDSTPPGSLHVRLIRVPAPSGEVYFPRMLRGLALSIPSVISLSRVALAAAFVMVHNSEVRIGLVIASALT